MSQQKEVNILSLSKAFFMGDADMKTLQQKKELKCIGDFWMSVIYITWDIKSYFSMSLSCEKYFIQSLTQMCSHPPKMYQDSGSWKDLGSM